MIYTDEWNMPRYISRQDAKIRDAKEGRKRLIGEQIHAYKQMVAGLNAVLFADSELEKRLKKHGLLKYLRMAEGLLRKVKNDLACTITIEQICTLQHDTREIYVQVHHAPQKDSIPVEKSTLSDIVGCARGLLLDEEGVSHNCIDCLAAAKQDRWQDCDLYHTLLKVDCVMDGDYGDGAYERAEDLEQRGLCPFLIERNVHKVLQELDDELLLEGEG